MSHHSLQRFFVCLYLFWLGTQSVLAATGGPDGYGYTWIDANKTGGPVSQFIEPTPAAVTVIGDTNTVAATVTLVHPWSGIYGEKVTQLRVSRNGFITDLLSDPGGDETNDAPLPQPPSQGGGNRLYVLHDALRLDPAEGAVYYEYFPESPHPLHACGVHVITWKQVHHATGDPARFDFQALLFDNFDILFQYGAGNPELGSNSTTGIQNSDATIGLQVAANTPNSILPNYAVRILPPVVIVTTGEDQFDVPAGPEISLREAIRDAAPGSRIEFADAYRLEISTNVANRIPLDGRNLALDGAAFYDSGPGVMIFGRRQLRHFRLFNGAHLYLGHIELNRGRGFASEIAGSMLVEDGSSLIAFRTEWNENRTEQDGGALVVRNSNTVVRLQNCTFRVNRAEGQGGAVALRNGATVRMDKVRFIANKADGGGGALFAQNGVLDVRASEFALNETPANGGAVQLGPGIDGLFHGVTFDDNRALNGGAVSIDNTISAINPPSALTFRRCTFSENIALAAGGAVFESSENFFGDAANPDFFYCTIVRNGAGLRGGGVATVKGQPRFSGTCLALNTVGVGENNYHTTSTGTAVSLGENLESGSEAGFTGTLDVQNADPLLSALGYHGGPVRTCMPLPGSPLIDGVGFFFHWPGADARGVGGAPFDGTGDGIAAGDIGAVEVGPTSWVTTSTAAALQSAVNAAPLGGVIRFSNVTHIVDADLSIPAEAMLFIFKEGQSLLLEGANVRLTNGPTQHVSFHNIDFLSASNGTLMVTRGASLSLERAQLRKSGYEEGSSTAAFAALQNRSGRLSLNAVDVLDGHVRAGLAQQGPDAQAWIRDSLFRWNEATDRILRIRESELVLQRSSVVENLAPGSITLDKAYSVLENNTVSGNRSPRVEAAAGQPHRAGAIEVYPAGPQAGGSYLVRNNTIVYNQQVSGFLFWGAFEINGDVWESANNIFAYNHDPDSFTGNEDMIFPPFDDVFNPFPIVVLPVVSTGGNLSNGSLGANLASDKRYTDPQLYPLSLGRNGTLHHAPRPGSPAIDAGVLVPAGLRDGRGGLRYRNGDGVSGIVQDIGAVESGRILTVTTALDENDGGLGLGAGDSLRECIAAAANFGGAVNIDLSLVSESTLNTQLLVSDFAVDIDGLDSKPHLTLDTGGKLFRTAGNAQLSVAGVRTGSSGGALRTENASVATWHGGSITGSTSEAIDSLETSRARVAETTLSQNSGARSAWVRGSSRAEFVGTTFTGNQNALYVVQAQNTAQASLHRATLTRNLSGTREFILSNASRGYLTQSTLWRNGQAASIAGSDALLVLHRSLLGNQADAGTVFVGAGGRKSLGHNISDRAPAFFQADLGDLTFRNAYLAPLFDYEGHGVPTYRPMAASPIFNAEVGALLPVRAFSNDYMVVTTTIDKEEAEPAAENLSLREAIRDVVPGGVVVFDPSLNNATFEITLNGGVIEIPDKSVIIDATSLPRGVQIVGRLLGGGGGNTLSLHAIHFRDSNAGPAFGGAVTIPGGNLVGSHLAFSGLHSDAGGGAIALQNGQLVLENVTFSGNTAAALGSAIYLLNATSRVEFATFADHGGAASGVVQGVNSTLHLYGSVFFRNGQASVSGATLASEGYNAFSDNPAGNVPTDSLNNSSLADAYEAFGDYGGWVPTYRPSPFATHVIDTLPPILAGSIPPPLQDARGFVRVAGASADWGAHESGGATFDSDGDGLPDWWELKYGFDPNSFTDADQDFDGDGYSLAEELAWGTNPFDPLSNPGISFSMSPAHDPTVAVTWNTLAGETYLLEATRSLISLPWLPVASLVGDGLPATLDHVSAIAETDQEFYRLRRADAALAPSWDIQLVDDSSDLGASLSLAYSPDGHPAIAYTQDAWHSIYFATRGPQRDWSIEEVYSHFNPSPIVLASRSLAFSPAGLPALNSSHIDVNTIRNHLFDGTNWNSTILFMPSVGDGGAGSNAVPRVYQANGEPAIAYRTESNGFIYYVTNNLFPSQVSVVDNSPGNSGRVSLAASPGGRVGLCYANTTQGELRYAERVGGVWQIDVVVPIASQHHALAFGLNGEPAVVYRLPNQRIRYAFFNGTQWQSEPVDEDNTTTGPMSLAFSPLGNPIIAYVTSPGVLRVAQRQGETWSSVAVVSPAAFPSLAIGPTGRPGVAFQDPIGQNVYFAEEVLPGLD